MSLNLISVIDKLYTIDDGYRDNEISLDLFYAYSVTNEKKINNVLNQSKKIIDNKSAGDGWANEINMIASVLFDINNAYKEKSLKLILERGDITGDVNRPYAESLEFEF